MFHSRSTIPVLLIPPFSPSSHRSAVPRPSPPPPPWFICHVVISGSATGACCSFSRRCICCWRGCSRQRPARVYRSGDWRARYCRAGGRGSGAWFGGRDAGAARSPGVRYPGDRKVSVSRGGHPEKGTVTLPQQGTVVFLNKVHFFAVTRCAGGAQYKEPPCLKHIYVSIYMLLGFAALANRLIFVFALCRRHDLKNTPLDLKRTTDKEKEKDDKRKTSPSSPS